MKQKLCRSTPKKLQQKHALWVRHQWHCHQLSFGIICFGVDLAAAPTYTILALFTMAPKSEVRFQNNFAGRSKSEDKISFSKRIDLKIIARHSDKKSGTCEYFE
jgi:hypothetical protein